ncbi:unnamed protein product [Pieris macdunnoughi]|uniref:Uncharacterized protein n=1 Tax=Pieris macdunnoughi TaxID=345717 RepID=A0A821Y1I1_9NEOP|nr:unnamed protein product [Pieris macdunnoughi]
MLKFLTHKLRTHSLNEENVSEKVEERDSGTESDDEAERADSGESRPSAYSSNSRPYALNWLSASLPAGTILR